MNKYFSRLINEVCRWKWQADIIMVRKTLHLELADNRFLVINEMPYNTDQLVMFDTYVDKNMNFHTKTYYVSSNRTYHRACEAIYNLSEDYAVALEPQKTVVT